ncbi:ribosome silencing factor [Desulfitibacter alkalitolerans]|uniref:ribosome silencing factor n=1 Tax=Desulfitibacter alkalitolerans TaxID=264641 RepID=UPI000480A547|nr:ribosome silencing factor [Desulfitibacter alkalitolerans]
MSDILNIAREAAKAALDKKARDVVILKMDDVTIITDYFVICTATNRTQAQAIADNIEDVMKENGMKILHREGLKEAAWILLDYGSVVVHIFQEDMRRFYDLETLWGDAAAVQVKSELG